MARPVNPESTRKGILAAAIALLLILSFLPANILSWLSGPRHLLSMALSPISDPVKRIATWIAPPAPRPDDIRLAQAEAERDRFRTLYQQALGTIDRLNLRIQDLERGAAVSEDRMLQVFATVIGNTTAASGGAIQVRAGSRKGVEMNTVVTTNGDQLIGRVSNVGAFDSWVTLLTDKTTVPIDGVILADDGKVLFNIRHLSPIRGQRMLQGQVQYKSSALGSGPEKNDAPAIDSIVRLEDMQWPRSAQRLIVGRIAKVTLNPSGRTIVEVKPLVDLESIGEVVLRTTPAGGADK